MFLRKTKPFLKENEHKHFYVFLVTSQDRRFYKYYVLLGTIFHENVMVCASQRSIKKRLRNICVLYRNY